MRKYKKKRNYESSYETPFSPKWCTASRRAPPHICSFRARPDCTSDATNQVDSSRLSRDRSNYGSIIIVAVPLQHNIRMWYAWKGRWWYGWHGRWNRWRIQKRDPSVAFAHIVETRLVTQQVTTSFFTSFFRCRRSKKRTWHSASVFEVTKSENTRGDDQEDECGPECGRIHGHSTRVTRVCVTLPSRQRFMVVCNILIFFS